MGSLICIGTGLGLTTQSRFKGRHGLADLLGIPARIGRFEGFGSFYHGTVAGAQFGSVFFALGGFTLEGIVNRLAEGIP